MLADDVAYLLDDFGSDLTLTRQADGTYDPTSGAITPISPDEPTTFQIRGVFINYIDANVDGTVIRMGDRRLLVRAAGAATTPAINDRVDGMQIVDVRSIAPNGIVIAWACQARK
jgi:hypothetical protein